MSLTAKLFCPRSTRTLPTSATRPIRSPSSGVLSLSCRIGRSAILSLLVGFTWAAPSAETTLMIASRLSIAPSDQAPDSRRPAADNSLMAVATSRSSRVTVTLIPCPASNVCPSVPASGSGPSKAAHASRPCLESHLADYVALWRVSSKSTVLTRCVPNRPGSPSQMRSSKVSITYRRSRHLPLHAPGVPEACGQRPVTSCDSLRTEPLPRPWPACRICC